MNTLHFPWLELAVAAPLAGALAIARLRDVETISRWSLAACVVTFVLAVGAWQDFHAVKSAEGAVAADPGDLFVLATGRPGLRLDELGAPLLPLAALLYLLTALATLRTKARRFSFTSALVSQSLTLATLACREPWGVIALLAATAIPPYLELRARRKPTRVYTLHMLAFVACLVVGWCFVEWEGRVRTHTLGAVAPLLAAVLIRSGVAPFHCWVTDLFEHATFGAALLYVTPMLGAYAAVRLVLPIAPEWVLQSMGLLSLATAVYAAGMSLVQREARRFFCYVFLSHSALVLVGLETVSPIGLTGGLCVWLSAAISLAGFGLTLRALEARHGRLSLARHHGVYEHTPLLAVCFFLTGMASVGFPGTFGFLATELLVDGAVQAYPYVGFAVVIAAALNGIAVVQAYFKLFTGARHVSAVPLQVAARERVAVLSLAALIFGGALYPQPGVTSRQHAAEQLLEARLEPAPDAAIAEREAVGRSVAGAAADYKAVK